MGVSRKGKIINLSRVDALIKTATLPPATEVVL